MIRLKGVSKSYGNVLALKKLNLEIERGEFFGFLGPNGAGKTTTIRIMAGLLEADKGEIFINDMNIREDPIVVKRLIGFIPDSPFLYEKLTAREYLKFVGRIFDMDSIEIKTKGDELLDIFGLSRWGDELIESYSHGMRQKTVMAGALLHDPQVIIVDEPMVGLDPKGINLVKEIFRKLAKENGITIFMSTHTLSIAEEVCSRIGIIHKGEMVADGSANDIKHFVGSGDKNLEEVFLILTEELSTTEVALRSKASL